MLYLEAFAHLFHHPFVEIGPVISDDLLGHPITTNNVMLDETSHNLLGDVGT